jgi:hypothetical protein
MLMKLLNAVTIFGLGFGVWMTLGYILGLIAQFMKGVWCVCRVGEKAAEWIVYGGMCCTTLPLRWIDNRRLFSNIQGLVMMDWSLVITVLLLVALAGIVHAGLWAMGAYDEGIVWWGNIPLCGLSIWMARR